MRVSVETAVKFFSLLWRGAEGLAEIRTFDPKGIVKPEFFQWPEQAERIAAYLEAVGRDRDDVFMGVLLRTGMKGDAVHTVKQTRWLWADVDKKKGATFATILSRLTHYPQVVVDSGHGWHMYWRLDRAVSVEDAQKAMRVLADRLNGDPVGDPARIMRVPGTFNNKDAAPMPVRLLRYDPVFTHRFADFDMPEPEPVHDSKFDITGDWKVSPKDAPPFGEGERNNGLTKLAGAMILKGMTEDDMLTALLAENDIRCNPPLPEREVAQIVRSVARYAT